MLNILFWNIILQVCWVIACQYYLFLLGTWKYIFTNYEAQQSTHITLVTVVGRLILHSTLVRDLLSSCHQLVPQDLNVLNRLKETVSEKEKKKKKKNEISMLLNCDVTW